MANKTSTRSEVWPHLGMKGFTYLWTLFAIAFLGVSMMLTTELWNTAIKRERERELIYVGNQFREAIGRYYETTPGGAKQYPPSLDDLLKDPRFPETRRHLRKVFQDPITRKKEWGVLRLGGRIAGVYSLSKEAPIKTAGFSLTEASFQGRSKYSEWVFVYPADLLIRSESKPNGHESGVGATSSIQLQSLPDSSQEARENGTKP